MDRKRFSLLIGQSVETGEFPKAEAWLPNFTDAELQAEQARRSAATQNVSGSVAVGSVCSQVEAMVPAAYTNYVSNAQVLNGLRNKADRAEVVGEREFKSGLMGVLDHQPTLDYMEGVNEVSKGSNLWIPASAINTEVSVAEVIKVAVSNGAALERPLYPWKQRAEFLSLFPPSVISGNNPESDALVNHLFVPSQPTSRLYGSPAHQAVELSDIRAENPGVNIISPSVFQSVGRWGIHANTGLALPTGWDATFERTIKVDDQGELIQKPFGGDVYVPYSDVHVTRSGVGRSGVDLDSHGRAWVGQNLDLAA
jgi:hypothetical protein